jgi:hypothetical protein
MRGLACKDVEHEALTAKEHGSELPELFSRQMDESHQSPFSCRCFSTMHKMRASIVFVLILLILVIFMAIALSIFLSNINNGSGFESEKVTRSGVIKQYADNIALNGANGDIKGIVLNYNNNKYLYYRKIFVQIPVHSTCMFFLDISCLTHADCNGILPFCYNGLCSPCSECQYCHDGIDNTCGTCGTGYPAKEEGSCSLPEQGNSDKVLFIGN